MTTFHLQGDGGSIWFDNGTLNEPLIKVGSYEVMRYAVLVHNLRCPGCPG